MGTIPEDNLDEQDHGPNTVDQHADVGVNDSASSGTLGTPGAQSDAPAEQPLWQGRTDIRHFGGSILLFAIAAFALFIAALIWLPQGWGLGCFVLIVIAALLGTARIALRILSTRYRLTTERLFIDRGILRQTIDQVELIRVDDIRVSKSVPDRLFGLGSIDVLSTDFTDQKIPVDGIADADHVAELIRSHMRTARRKSLFIENL